MKQESITVIAKIINHALQDPHSQEELIVNRRGLKIAKRFRRAVKTVISKLNSMANQLAKDCRKNNDTGALIFLYKIETSINFYKEELNIANRVIDEYKCYLDCGHRLESLLGKNRPEELMFKHTNEFIDIFEEM